MYSNPVLNRNYDSVAFWYRLQCDYITTGLWLDYYYNVSEIY